MSYLVKTFKVKAVKCIKVSEGPHKDLYTDMGLHASELAQRVFGNLTRAIENKD